MEEEIRALALSRGHRDQLKALMAKKEAIGDLLNHLRKHQQTLQAGSTAAAANSMHAASMTVSAGANGVPAGADRACANGTTTAADTASWAQHATGRTASGTEVASLSALAANGSATGCVGHNRDVVERQVAGGLDINRALVELLTVMQHLDGQIEPMLGKDGSAFNQRQAHATASQHSARPLAEQQLCVRAWL
jgi:hypothetical protein